MADTERHQWMKGDNSIFQTIAYGLTKIVLFPNDLKDVVVKIPFIGVDEYSYTDNDDIEWIRRTDFEGIQSGDYCERESFVYKQAVKEHVEKFFACTEYVTDALGFVPIYVSERCEQFEPGGSAIYDSRLDSVEIPHDVASVLVEQYESKDIDRLVSFIDENKIGDLHEGNWGYGKDGKLKIIDYSSFYETFKD